MKILTAAQMREVDRLTIEAGIPGLVLMENAAHRVVEVLARKYAPLGRQRVVVICGKGNNGGDGLAIARQLHVRFRPASLDVVLAGPAGEFRGDAAANYAMLRACGCVAVEDIAASMRRATLLIDAVLGTGLTGPARGRAAELIHEINTGFREARVVAVDLASGLQSDSGEVSGEAVSAECTVTFTAPKLCHVLSPAREHAGELHVGQIGSRAELYENDASIFLSLSDPARFRHLFQPRIAESNKGLYGHALIVAGGRGKTGAAAMAGIAALRAGAGLVTVASAASAIMSIASYAPELMTEPLEETVDGQIRELSPAALRRKNVVALGPGMGTHDATVQLIRRLADELTTPVIVDADGLNALAGAAMRAQGQRVFTPHPGEMARLTGKTIDEVQADRIPIARAYAQQHGVYLVLKGNRTVIAFPDGSVWINPTGSPALATGGTGDVLTGLLAGLIAQFSNELEPAVLAGVYLHGRAGELGARDLGEKALIATDLFRYLPEAMREVSALPDPL